MADPIHDTVVDKVSRKMRPRTEEERQQLRDKGDQWYETISHTLLRGANPKYRDDFKADATTPALVLGCFDMGTFEKGSCLQGVPELKVDERYNTAFDMSANNFSNIVIFHSGARSILADPLKQAYLLHNALRMAYAKSYFPEGKMLDMAIGFCLPDRPS